MNQAHKLLSCLLVALHAASAVGQSRPAGPTSKARQATPQTLFVAQDKGQVRSGPGENYYVTSQLEPGESIDAYQRTDSGWLAIRPPGDSFSWVKASDAYLLPGGKVIEIIQDKAISWIGTDSEEAERFHWQVQLSTGEQLSVLGEASRQGKDGTPELWYRISPPSGEFRWIHESDVARVPPKSSPIEHGNEAEDKPVPRMADRQSTAEVAAASADSNAPVNTESERSVQPASYQGDTILEGVFEGGASTLEEIPPGAIVEGPSQGNIAVYPDDETVYLDSEYVGGSVGSLPREYVEQTGNNFSGWHALDFDDDGLHLTFLERILGRRGPMIDPRSRDPFSLAMPVASELPKNTRVPQGVIPRRTGYDDGGSSGYQPPRPLDTHRPWRDPRALRENRMRGYEGLSATSPQSVMDGLRSSFRRLGAAFEPSGSAGPAVGPESFDRTARDTSYPTTRDYVPNTGFQPVGGTPSSSDTGPAVDNIDWYGVPARQDQTTQAAPASRSDLSVSSDLDQIQVALSEIVTRPASDWNLQELTQRTEHFIQNGATPLERGQARLLLDRINEFKQHARRTAFVPGMNVRASYASSRGYAGSPVAPSSVKTAGYQTPLPPTPDSGSPTNRFAEPYDATGWVVRVYSNSPGQPTHALSDRDGRILSYVTALPGLNLDIYLNKPVGIVGRRGFLPQLQKPQIQAERVVRL